MGHRGVKAGCLGDYAFVAQVFEREVCEIEIHPLQEYPGRRPYDTSGFGDEGWILDVIESAAFEKKGYRFGLAIFIERFSGHDVSF